MEEELPGLFSEFAKVIVTERQSESEKLAAFGTVWDSLMRKAASIGMAIPTPSHQFNLVASKETRKLSDSNIETAKELSNATMEMFSPLKELPKVMERGEEPQIW